ncbi:putative ATP-dependent DNA helicase HFM1 [Tubulanus polymorphus]|uniref:putative ATP-dependent DNA helicase HFM1 n=1 Tax=Tubulanus polymorphus TaxID=672921 RepID=UPI003DA2AEBD
MDELSPLGFLDDVSISQPPLSQSQRQNNWKKRPTQTNRFIAPPLSMTVRPPAVEKNDGNDYISNDVPEPSFKLPLPPPIQTPQRIIRNHSSLNSTPRGLLVFDDAASQHLTTPLVAQSSNEFPVQVEPTRRAMISNLRSTSEICEQFRGIFNFPYFNIVQSKVFDDVMYTDRSLVVCAPTGSGKTAVFELAIVRLMVKFQHETTPFKVVYMAPLKALCSERFEDWRMKFGTLGLKCMELTGDTQLDDLFELQSVNIILTTPEKWDSMTRRWKDNQSLLQQVKLFLVDEIHTLNDNARGATVEAVISRMKTVQTAVNRLNNSKQSLDSTMRFLAVSATIPNVEDISAWFGSESSPAIHYSLDDSFRPVKLRKVVLGYEYSQNSSEFKFDLFLSYKLAGIIETYSDKKPTLVFCSTRKGVQQSASILIKDARYVINAQHKDELITQSGRILESKLRDVLVFGVGYHHAGLDMNDRKIIEEMFLNGKLPVLFATSTLAMGINLPAHLVVIKSTMFYQLGMYQEYSETQILQMIGRAGRPQFDTSATAVIMTKTDMKAQYQMLLNGTQVIESSLHRNLIEHLNAEIVLRTITDITVVLEWLRSTFLYIRALKNPRHYGIPVGLNKEQIEKRLQDIIVSNLNMLANEELILTDEDHFDVKPSDTGHLMARHCVLFETMKLFRTVKGTETIQELVSLLAGCKEFSDIKLRMNERRLLNVLNKDKNRATIRFPMDGKIKTNDMKVNCLMQAQFGCLSLQDFGLSQDTGRIFRVASRVSKCLAELLWRKPGYVALLSAVQLMKCIHCRLWENSAFVSKQLEGIGPTLSSALNNAGMNSLKKLEESNPREIEMVVNRNPPFGNLIVEQLKGLPKYQLSIEQVPNYGEMRAELCLAITLTNMTHLEKKLTAGIGHTCALIVGDSDNNIIYKTRIGDSILMKTGCWMKKIDVTRTPTSDVLNINFISQTWAGFDIQNTYTPFYSSNRITDHQLTDINYQKNENTIMQPNPSGGVDKPQNETTVRSCSHRCYNKQYCGHECCKNGIAVRKQKEAKTPSEPAGAVSGKRSLTNQSVANYVSGLKHKIDQIPPTPNLKRLKYARNSNSSVDLKQYSYNPPKPYTYNKNTSRNTAVASLSKSSSEESVCFTASKTPKLAFTPKGWDGLDLYQQRRISGSGSVLKINEVQDAFTAENRYFLLN